MTGSDAAAPPRVLLGVSGGVAAYKACEILRLLRSAGADVVVVPTPAALKFVGSATFEALSGHPVATDVFTDVHNVAHVATGQEADLVVIAPATADLLARAAAGRADDLLTATLLVTRAPVLMAPAMHSEMWTHPSTVDNVATLRRRGTFVLDPAVGRLTGADSGVGRLPEPEHIVSAALLLLRRPDALPRDLVGRRVLVTAGGTREALDPVRYLGNRSSGKQGFAIALAAVARGAQVTVIAANTALAAPPGVTVVEVTDARDLQRQVQAHVGSADAVVMAAAVADFRPAAVVESKIKKQDGRGPAPIQLLTNPDILAELGAQRTGQRPVIVGFAAETGDENGSVLDHGRAKLARKGCDLLVVNRVGPGRAFEVEDNAATILAADGSEPVQVAFGPKIDLAAAICDLVAERLTRLDSGDREQFA
ncbi:bifunctional phosphopantothenoylcysteine decarboxylase/phosphopantothenate--cysteine ligase CoaBC [Nakamurella panacisegetis]|uniref:bifunctional phosphopantothenoylcysteine decarboxylase/phosphopantothenate--cysteine ligase CoaBC n=1 Tax=Nakamurella panacisegetis TaxID=1090615 RepID=UPI000B837683